MASGGPRTSATRPRLTPWARNAPNTWRLLAPRLRSTAIASACRSTSKTAISPTKNRSRASTCTARMVTGICTTASWSRKRSSVLGMPGRGKTAPERVTISIYGEVRTREGLLKFVVIAACAAFSRLMRSSNWSMEILEGSR